MYVRFIKDMNSCVYWNDEDITYLSVSFIFKLIKYDRGPTLFIILNPIKYKRIVLGKNTYFKWCFFLHICSECGMML